MCGYIGCLFEIALLGSVHTMGWGNIQISESRLGHSFLLITF